MEKKADRKGISTEVCGVVFPTVLHVTFLVTLSLFLVLLY